MSVFQKLGSERVFRAFSELVLTRPDPNFREKMRFSVKIRVGTSRKKLEKLGTKN